MYINIYINITPGIFLYCFHKQNILAVTNFRLTVRIMFFKKSYKLALCWHIDLTEQGLLLN